MRYTLFTLLLTLMGCGASKPPVVFVPPPPMPLSVSTMPQLVVVYRDVRLLCRMPTDVGDGYYIFGMTGYFESQGPIDRKEYSKIVNAPCETMHIYCGYREAGKEKPEMVSIDIEPVGECRQ